MRAEDIRAVQSAAGNRATQRAMRVGAAGDTFEREADAVAQSIVGQTGAAPQRAAEEDELQAKHVQREAMPEEDELQAKHVQREAMPEEDELQAKHVQREAMPEEDELQAKHVQREAMPEEDELQAKHVQREPMPEVGMEGGVTSPETGAAIEGARSGGRALPQDVQTEMESHFNADFSNVRTHEGSEAKDLNDRLSSRAFTTGSDIFIGREGLNAGTRGGKELLAHELTHVVQQGAARTMRQRKA